MLKLFYIVGVAGFEPTAPASQTRPKEFAKLMCCQNIRLAIGSRIVDQSTTTKAPTSYQQHHYSAILFLPGSTGLDYANGTVR